MAQEVLGRVVARRAHGEHLNQSTTSASTGARIPGIPWTKLSGLVGLKYDHLLIVDLLFLMHVNK